MTATTIHSTTIKIDDSIKIRVKRLAESRQRTPHWLMQEAIREYVEREEKREALRQDALRAWDEYQATGMHVTSEEADLWLAKLADGQGEEPPVCHV
ncbi:MAG TPA: ribbon-helix-helix protein, CopG family [Gallionella sp.]|nr:ribbon-helix-helix protein, CopG family [Gallionella sp.]